MSGVRTGRQRPRWLASSSRSKAIASAVATQDLRIKLSLRAPQRDDFSAVFPDVTSRGGGFFCRAPPDVTTQPRELSTRKRHSRQVSRRKSKARGPPRSVAGTAKRLGLGVAQCDMNERRIAIWVRPTGKQERHAFASYPESKSLSASLPKSVAGSRSTRSRLPSVSSHALHDWRIAPAVRLTILIQKSLHLPAAAGQVRVDLDFAQSVVVQVIDTCAREFIERPQVSVRSKGKSFPLYIGQKPHQAPGLTCTRILLDRLDDPL